MDWQQFAAATGAAGTILGAVLGSLGRTWSDSKAADQRSNLDQLQLALATISKLEARSDIMGGQIANLGKRIEGLLMANAELSATCKQQRRDIAELQRQVIGLGAVPLVLPDPIQTEARVGALERRSVANADGIAANAEHIQAIEEGHP